MFDFTIAGELDSVAAVERIHFLNCNYIDYVFLSFGMWNFETI